MKKYFTALCALVLAAGCAKENIAPEQASGEVLLTSYAAGQPLTRTAVTGDRTSGFTANWTATDAIGVYTTKGTENNRHSITLLDDGTAKFTGKVVASSGKQKIFAYSPYAADAGDNHKAVKMNIPSEQTMEGASYDASAAIMVGKPQVAVLKESCEIGDWQFAHLNSYILFTVDKLTAPGVSEDEKVSSIEFRASGKSLTGGISIDMDFQEMKFTAPEDYVKVNVPEGQTLKNLSAWAVVAPFSLNDEELTVLLNTKTYCISKKVRLTQNFIAGNVYTINLSIDKDCCIRTFGFAKDYELSERKCYWRGGTANAKTYEVNSSIDWNVSISDPDEASVTKNSDGRSFTVVFPRSKWPAEKKYTVTLEPAAAVEGVAPKTMDLFLTSGAYQANSPQFYETNDDGSVRLSLDSKNSVWLKTPEEFKYGNYVWTFEDVNLKEGYFCVNNWQGGIYMMLKYGQDIALLAGGGTTVDAKGNTVCFGFDNGSGGVWNDTKKFTEGAFPTDCSQLKSIRLLIAPTKRSGTAQNLTVARKVWINDVLVLDNSENVGDVWAANSSVKGFNYMFGLQDAVGSLVLKTFEIDEDYRNYMIDGKEVIFRDEFNTDGEVNPTFWTLIPKGTAAWQTDMSGKPEHSYVKNGNLVLAIKPDSDGVVRSGGIRTEYKMNVRHNCHIEARIKFVNDSRCAGQAFWLMPDSRYQIYAGWPDGGEMDILEHNYLHDYVQQTVHSHYIHDVDPKNTAGKFVYPKYNPGQYNIYGLDILENNLVFYTNGVETMRYENLHLADETAMKQWPFTSQYYLILSTGLVGEKKLGEPSYMHVDWVRVTKL